MTEKEASQTMSSPSTVAFFGLRFRIDAAEDIEALEKRSHLHQQFAQQASLNHYWANFDEASQLYYSFLGRRLGIISPENEREFSVTADDFDAIQRETKEKLRSLGLELEPGATGLPRA
jgi:hypothetical protein